MNDYKDLLGDINDCLIAQPSGAVCKRVLREAADAIEQLGKERDMLQLQNHLERCEHEHTRKERDAAVADLTVFDKCKICKHYDERSANYGYTELCENCGAYPWADDEEPNKWEWRGVQEDNDETD